MQKATKFDTLIVGGTVIDGKGTPRFRADIGVTNGRITAIGDLTAAKAAKRYNAAGKIVAPGFIDAHTHDDRAVLDEPLMHFKISQGVTTVITGNCGISLAPLRGDLNVPMPIRLVEPRDPPRGTSFAHFADYLAAVEQNPPSVNVVSLVGHSTLRLMTMDALDRPASEKEISEMQELLTEALEAGAFGISTGTAYPTAMCAPYEEVVAVCEPLRKRKAIYVSHMRNEGDEIVAALDETFRIGRSLNVSVVVSHHKLMGRQNFGRSEETLSFIRDAMEKQRIGLDCYPYDASSTMLHEDERRLQDRIRIATSAAHPEHQGKDLQDVADEWGVSLIDAVRRLQPASAIYFCMDEKDVRNILKFERTMIGSDGLPCCEQPHPRLWGTFPRVLGHFSRDLNLFPLETAVWKMTGLTAETFGLTERGTLSLGNYADIVVFDADSIIDRATYEEPTNAADGIETVFVNGQITWIDGVHTGRRCGEVVRPS